ncbi:MAG: fluoride efflux transporter CrcB [Symploca sp. SIO1C4]|uniref:Fluoride-specific ion channel FluC n=1 Tax=Symploca sp. SIO1C4 TaxID=2607765 RepID=A0A6B3NQH6_9CYAN|nr:fluoride efflux transporter CrcB [Symploca sp. SIO1C4]NET06025.1 fluoride efflux transporter CrcB [Symploca sp. SIO2B6]
MLLMLQEPNFRYPIAVSLGAIAGALCRYYLTLWFTQRFGTTFPYSTLIINLSGCFAMGLVVTFTLERVATIPREVTLIVTTGFLGAYTTFSTYGLETFILRHAGSFTAAIIYWAGSATLGVISVELGVILARLGK